MKAYHTRHTHTHLLQLRYILSALDAAVKQRDKHGLIVVEVGAVVDALVVHYHVYVKQGVPLGSEIDIHTSWIIDNNDIIGSLQN